MRANVLPSPCKSKVALGALLKIPVLKEICPPVQLPAPPLINIPPLKDFEDAPLTVRLPLAATTRLDALLPTVPAVQFSGPPSVSVPEPVRIALVKLKAYVPLAERYKWYPDGTVSGDKRSADKDSAA